MIMIKNIPFASLMVASVVLLGCATTSNNDSDTARAQQNQTPPISSVTQVNKQLSPAENKDIALTLKQIMSNPDWLGRQAQNPFYSPLGDAIFYSRKREGSVVDDLYMTKAGEGNGTLVPLQDLHKQAKNTLDNKAFEFVAWLFEGNIFIQNRLSKEIKQLTKDAYAAHNIQYFKDANGKQGISFQRGNSFYTVDANTGMQHQVFDWQFAEKASANKPAEDYIAQEQQKLIEYVRVQRKNSQERFNNQTELEQQNTTLMAKRFYFAEDQTTVFASLSPNTQFAIVVTEDKPPSKNESDIMPDYIEENGRIKAQSVRQRVADAKPVSHTLYFLDIANNTVKKLPYVGLPGYNEDVLKEVKLENAKAKGERYTSNRLPRDIELMITGYATETPIKWHNNSQHVALMLEAWDNKDRWIVTVDTESPKLVTQHRMHDTAWVNYRYNQFGWFNESLTLFLLSEESGYSQLYTKAISGELRAITHGKFVVDNVVLSQSDEYFYYKANKKHPGIYEVYRTPAQGGQAEALTDLNGMTDFVMNPSEDSLVLIHSTLAMPPELYTLTLDKNAQAKQLTNTVSDEFLSIDWTIPSIVAIPSSHTEQPIYSRVYLPKQATQQKNRAVVFNHGAGYLQNSHLGWSGYFREFMFHSFLTSQGYVVLDMDYRASAGYGRDWRTAIYRQMGTPEVQDLHDGVDWLVENANVDRNRIGTYGGSYGGFLTFMSLFNAPDLFQAGAALRPVSDWAHYNTPYTSNILNTPDLDPIAYERSSPIYFADGLTKPLLINAPMVDNNVFFVDVVRLVQILIELEKEDFETAIYPVEAHGFVQPSSWLDEYRRIFKLFETHL